MSASSHLDFSKLLVPFQKCPKGVRLVDHFSELKAFKEFTQQQDDNIIKIAICTSDIDSPFMKIKDRQAMLESVFDYLEIGLKTQAKKEMFEQIFTYQHEAIAGCWARYYQMQYNIQYTEWAMTKQTYDILIFELNRPKQEGEDELAYVRRRVNITRDLKSVGAELKIIEAELFPDTKQKKVIAMHEIKIISYPEKYAKSATAI